MAKCYTHLIFSSGFDYANVINTANYVHKIEDLGTICTYMSIFVSITVCPYIVHVHDNM